MTELPEYIHDRVFDAPRDMVWRAWTDPQLLSRWYGPGVDTVIHKFDLKPGGLWLNEMKWGDKSDLSKMEFQEVVPPEKLVWHHSSADADWNVVASAMMPDWPRVLLTTVTFEEVGAKTKVRMTMVPLDASEAEIACFAGAMAGMEKGWGSGYAILDEMLAELQAEEA
ncbi:SRPBCC domain-containing protein [Pelagibius litoralis]|uniref:SRPBCC domain-containing protein n=1 Tax=Pelagibius litoralis TaxID=374515 RepID=A0A967C4A9_9PROT|nr:SRPBCC domain-containing protein [Pelagibius litoralis]NIA68455.1 SRPBCC domain-containing protein [Pelagibius litoralis]